MSGLFSHRKCSVSVGNATAAFALALLEKKVNPGVWYPEEDGVFIDFETHAMELLRRSAKGCRKFVLSQAPWQIGSKPRQVGIGLYLE